MATTNTGPSYDTLYVKQLNLHHCKSATALICNTLQKMQTSNQKCIFLVQEPWIKGDKIQGLQLPKYNLFQSHCQMKKRTCILAPKEISITLLPQFCDGDLTTVLLNTGKHGQNKEIIFCSGYLPYEETNSIPSQLFKQAVEYSSDAGIPIVLGCDSNAHHIIWGSTDINLRGSLLFEYICSTNLVTLNKEKRFLM